MFDKLIQWTKGIKPKWVGVTLAILAGVGYALYCYFAA